MQKLGICREKHEKCGAIPPKVKEKKKGRMRPCILPFALQQPSVTANPCHCWQFEL
jgi:hypothetical protein